MSSDPMSLSMLARLIKVSPLGRRAALLGAGALVVACVQEERRAPATPELQAEPPAAPSSTPAPPQYLVADPSPSRAGALTLPLGAPGVYGMVLGKRRVVVGQGDLRTAPDVTADPLLGASRVPRRFGGGFLFWTANTLYRADAFDAKLLPVTRLPDTIVSISFAPRSLVARTRSGERWGIALPGGERAAIAPLGAADVQALDDGRALAWSDQGAVFTSTDGGAHWTDATAQVKSAPLEIATVSDELWLFESNGGASRLEVDGRLSWFAKTPTEPTRELRVNDPRWRGRDPPLRTAFRSGAALDDGTALVAESGDLVRIDVRTGDVLAVAAGRLPPDAQCEAVTTAGDVLFACLSRAISSAFVVSRTLTSEPPTIEQTLAGGGQFFAGDDGGLAYSGSCRGVPPGPSDVPVVCVRTPSGTWQERDVSGLASDGGAPEVHVVRWIPRQDGHVVALVSQPSPGIYDPETQRLQPIADEARDAIGRSVTMYGARAGMHGILGRQERVLVDASWSFVRGGALRGWQRHGEGVELSEGGELTRSPYAFEIVFAGALGLGRSTDGRLYQSSDHGASWIEVASPPPGAEALDLVSCTSAGCDLGSFYRVGWSLRPPRAEPPKPLAEGAPEVRRARGLELACRPRGPIASKVVPRTADSPEDLALGAARLAVATDRSDWSFVRTGIVRGILSPIHDSPGAELDTTQSLRGLLSGFATTRHGDVIRATGPNKDPMALRRSFAYVAPFDPLGRVVRTGIAMKDVVAAGRRAGMTADEVLAEDVTEIGVAVTLTSVDPSAPSDVALHNADHGLLAIFRGERARVAFRTSQDSASVVSGVVLAGAGGAAVDETAFFEVDQAGVGRVFKVGPDGVTDLFDVGVAANEAYCPANPDALAVGPGGALAILRTPSGSEPASSLDPAYVMAPATPPAPLAPWSELKLAGDPACQSEPGGWRATLQLRTPWVRVTTPELRVDESPMIARVRWTTKRVCLEGFEVRTPSVTVRVPQPEGGYDTETVTTWLVAKGGSYARVAIADGLEWRQAIDCSIVTTGP